MDVGGERGDVAGRGEQAFDAVVDEVAEVRGAPPDDRQAGAERLGGGGAVGLDAAGEGEGVGGREQRRHRAAGERSVDHDPAGEVGPRDAPLDRGGVGGRDVPPADEVQRHVAGGTAPTASTSVRMSLFGSQLATCRSPSRRPPRSAGTVGPGGQVAPGLDDDDPGRVEAVLADEVGAEPRRRRRRRGRTSGRRPDRATDRLPRPPRPIDAARALVREGHREGGALPAPAGRSTAFAASRLSNTTTSAES